MAQATAFPRHIVLAAASIAGALLASAVHMLGVRFGLDLGGLWRKEFGSDLPVGAAIALWLIATAAFAGGYLTANILHRASAGTLPPRLRQLLIVLSLLILAGAGQVASGPSPIPSLSGMLAGIAAVTLGGVMAFSGAHFALRGSD